MNTAIVTGAGGDIGRAISVKLISVGWQVCGFDIDEEKLSETHTDVAGSESFLPIKCDVRSMASVQAAVQQAEERFGTLNALINNAGGITKPTLQTTSEEDWLADIDLNLNGAWRCISAVQSRLIAQDESSVILNIASINGFGIYGYPGYSVAKAGLIHLTRFCASELGKYGVRSIAICPGTVKTKAWKSRLEEDPAILEKATGWYPSRALCSPEDVASFTEIMIRAENTQLNGAVIPLDGGLTAGSDRLASEFAGVRI